MSDIGWFVQNGWRNIWKQRSILFFSALPLLDSLFQAFRNEPKPNSAASLLDVVESLVSLILFLISIIGVPYIAYSSSINKSVTVREVLSTVRRVWARVLGCSCLVLLASSPCLYLALAFSWNSSTQSFQSSNNSILLLFPLSIFSALWDFSIFGFLANDWGIRKNIKETWALFAQHFGTLAILGIIMLFIGRILIVLTGAFTVLIQSGVDTTAFSNINLFNPFASLQRNLLFVVLSGIGQTVLTSFHSSVFATAYQKYQGVELLSRAVSESAA